MFFLIGLLVLAADIYGIVKTFQSKAGTGSKVLWTLFILLLSPIGIIFWFFMGPKK